jgi:hypothetical protein
MRSAAAGIMRQRPDFSVACIPPISPSSRRPIASTLRAAGLPE